jgi:hypothetical protein
VSDTIEAVLVVLGVAVLGGVSVLLHHRFFPPPPDAEPREDVAEYIAMMVSVLYALVLGLALVAVWDTNSSASADVAAEAGALHQTYLLADGMPADQQQDVRAAADRYARHVVDVEWPHMVAGQGAGQEGWRMLDTLRAAGRIRQGATLDQQAVGQEFLAQVSALDDARRGRDADATGGGLSPMLWVGLIIGGVLTVAFMFLFGIERNLTHIVMVMGLSAFIAFTVLLIYQLDAPFGGVFGADPSPFTRYFKV